MKKQLLILLCLPLLFSSCEDEDVTTQSVNYITACTEAEFEIQFFGTEFWDSDLNVWYDLNNNGNKLTNPISGTSQFCRKYIDDATVDPNNPFGSIDSEPTNGSEVEVEFNSDGTMDVTLECTDGESWISPSGTFEVEIYLEDINSYVANQTYVLDNDWLNVRAGGDSWNGEHTISFTVIDPVNHIYEGSVNIAVTNYWDVLFFPDFYEPGTSLNFNCEINFSFDKL